ncbi:MAG: tRNA 2-thiouridine(34) synthase MnmA [Psittacicella sp.]
MNKSKENTKVIVGMSGGVDSSVAAYLLKQEGYNVIGLFMKNWEEDDDTDYCTSKEDMDDAQKVCDKIGIKLLKINFSAEYWDRVFEYFLDEYKNGRTPNPDVLCNKEIKFKAFLDYAINDLEADYIATGHYAKVLRTSDGAHLVRAIDQNKDQTYFLCALNEYQISKTLFPIGDYNKPEIREIAKEQGFITASKKDSTGICFIGERKFKDFLSKYLPANPGKIVSQAGEAIGTHNGLMYYTLGQRKGLGIGGVKNLKENPWYVYDKDMENNVLRVCQGSENKVLFSKGCLVSSLNWIGKDFPVSNLECSVKLRYRQKDIDCILIPLDKSLFRIDFINEQSSVTPGQFAVLYSGDRCLGGGVIDTIIR